MMRRFLSSSARLRQPWRVTASHDGRALVVAMNSNAVNCINERFNKDFADALDVIERQPLPVVLTSASETTFCAGLDLRWMLGRDATRDVARQRMSATLRDFACVPCRVPCARRRRSRRPQRQLHASVPVARADRRRAQRTRARRRHGDRVRVRRARRRQGEDATAARVGSSTGAAGTRSARAQ